MASIGYITIDKAGENLTEGASDKPSLGAAWDEDHVDESKVFAFESGALIAVDPNTGNLDGPRRRQPVKVVKALDKASPKLWDLMGRQEDGSDVTITLKLFHMGVGQREHCYTIEWKNCIFVEGKTVLPDVNDSATDGTPLLEEWSFIYSEANWTHETGGTSGSYTYNKQS